MKKISAFVLTLILALTFAQFPTFAAQNTITLFPEYPSELPRDYDYEVTVSNGTQTYSLPVYNATRQKNNYVSVKNTDSWRRFCEFSFTGEVTVSIKVKTKMSSYAVLPTSKGIASSCEDDVVSFKITEPSDLVFRINDDHNTILSIFAYPPETDVPNESDSNLIYFKAGLNNTDYNFSLDEYGQLTIPDGYEVYLEPGALVTARLKTVARQTEGIKIYGRGAFLDPRLNRYNDNTYMLYGSNGSNYEIRDVKFLDAHCFNLCFSNIDNLTIDNIKILSSEISSDGISIWGKGDGSSGGKLNNNLVVKNSYLYCNDNAFVITSANGLSVTNCTIGTGYAIIYPQGTVNNWTLDNIDVFRMGNFFRATMTVGDINNWNITASNIRAEDALTCSAFIRAVNQYGGNKNITFNNISLPALTTYEANLTTLGTTSLTANCNNVYINGVKLNSSYNGFKKGTVTGLTLNYGSTFNETLAGANTYNPKSASYVGDKTVTIGGYTLPFDEIGVINENGVNYLPAGHVLSYLGYEITQTATSLTAENANGKVVLKDSFADVYGFDSAKLTNYPILRNGKIMVSATLLEEVFGLTAEDNGTNIKINALLERNLLKNGGFENLNYSYFNTTYANTTDWAHYNFGNMNCETSTVRSGNCAMYLWAKNGGDRGVAQNISKAIQTYGAGTYRFEAYVKLGDYSHDNYTPATQIVFGMVSPAYQLASTAAFNSTITQTVTADTWTKFVHEITVTDPSSDGYDRALFFIGAQAPSSSNNCVAFYVDDAALYYTPAVSNADELKALTPPIVEGEVFDCWYDTKTSNPVTVDNISGKVNVMPKYKTLNGMTGTLATSNTDDKPVERGAEYTNSFYLQGAQARVGQSTETGLRFITVNNKTFENALKENYSGVKYGTLVAVKKYISGGLLNADTEKVSNVQALQIWRTTEETGTDYQKYTACVINIDKQNFKTDVVARPYFTYTDNSGIERIYYGGQYDANLYKIAKSAYNAVGSNGSYIESEQTRTQLWEKIISVIDGNIGDNDESLKFN